MDDVNHHEQVEMRGGNIYSLSRYSQMGDPFRDYFSPDYTKCKLYGTENPSGTHEEV